MLARVQARTPPPSRISVIIAAGCCQICYHHLSVVSAAYASGVVGGDCTHEGGRTLTLTSSVTSSSSSCMRT